MTDSIPRLGATIGHAWLAIYVFITNPLRGLLPEYPAWVDRADAALAEAYGLQ